MNSIIELKYHCVVLLSYTSRLFSFHFKCFCFFFRSFRKLKLDLLLIILSLTWKVKILSASNRNQNHSTNKRKYELLTHTNNQTDSHIKSQFYDRLNSKNLIFIRIVLVNFIRNCILESKSRITRKNVLIINSNDKVWVKID